MKSLFNLVATLLLAIFFTGCASLFKKTESQKFNTWADKTYNEAVSRSPEWQTYRGLKKDYDKLDDLSEKREMEEHEIAKANLAALDTFNYAELDEETKITYRLIKRNLTNHINDFKFRHHYYSLSHMFGRHSGVVSFLINMHRVSSESDARAYVSRVQAIKDNFVEFEKDLDSRAQIGAIPPKYVYPKIYSTIENLLEGFPLTEDKEKPHSIYADFKNKVENLKLSTQKTDDLMRSLEEALQTSFKPAYLSLMKKVKSTERLSNNKAGVWKLPNGKEFYNMRLARNTTTNLTADEIHKLGLSEVKRIHSEMRSLQKRLGIKGDLNKFFHHIKNNKSLYMPNTKEGRDGYLSLTNKIINNIKAKTGELFGIQAKDELIVKAVEPFREKSAGRAFYQGPSKKGKRPGIYYVNLYDLSTVPKYEMEALAYHEAIPGHHMQISIANNLDDLPEVRKDGYTAYTEGWGLYAELLPKEIGFYQDPYSDFGRLSMELWRACRLVVDTGIHAKKWSRRRAIRYLAQNTPNAQTEIIRAIDRYIINPGQATAYKVGMLKILELREKSKKTLGGKFDIREFHDEVLRHGPLPLDELSAVIDSWLEKKKTKL